MQNEFSLKSIKSRIGTTTKREKTSILPKETHKN